MQSFELKLSFFFELIWLTQQLDAELLLAFPRHKNKQRFHIQKIIGKLKFYLSIKNSPNVFIKKNVSYNFRLKVKIQILMSNRRYF